MITVKVAVAAALKPDRRLSVNSLVSPSDGTVASARVVVCTRLEISHIHMWLVFTQVQAKDHGTA